MAGSTTTPEDPLGTPAPAAAGSSRSRLDPGRARLVAVVGLTALVTLFAVLNLKRVSVNWLIGTWRTPLIVVIVLSALLGALVDRVVQRRSRRDRAAVVEPG